MNKTDFQELASKYIFNEVNRLYFNKNRTITGFSIHKEPSKQTIKISFSLPAPFSKNSDILILIRENGNIEKWAKVWDEKTPEHISPIIFAKLDSVAMIEQDVKAIAKHLLKEIDG